MNIKTIQDIIFGVTFVACGAGQWLDDYTTGAGLSRGFIEANSFAGKVQAKIGAAGFFVVKCMVIPAIGAALYAFAGFGLSLAWLIPLAVEGFIAGIRNWILLAKNKVCVF